MWNKVYFLCTSESAIIIMLMLMGSKKGTLTKEKDEERQHILKKTLYSYMWVTVLQYKERRLYCVQL